MVFSSVGKYLFSEKLTEGVIQSRPNRFIMQVKIDGAIVKCHCPSTGRIGSIKFEDIPCLLSKSSDPARKTPYTVEAFSLDPVKKKHKAWIGINQVKANDYVSHFLRTGQLEELTVPVASLRREVKLANSRIDFLVNDKDFIEVKTLLMDIPCEGHPMYRKNTSKFNSFDRLIKHFGDASGSIGEGTRAVLLMCYLYDAKPFEVPTPAESEKRIVDAAKSAADKGMENWQLNLKIDEEGVSLVRYLRLDLFKP
jgi:sugar fermentation stimulation protein A